MLAHARTESEVVRKKAVVLGRSKVVSQSYFCPNSTCLADEVAVRSASSFAQVWLVTDEEIDCSWLMMASKPCCPHCDSTLVSAHREYAEGARLLM